MELRALSTNITTYGPQFLDYCFKEHTHSDGEAQRYPHVIMGTEVHAPHARVPEASNKMRKLDYDSFWAPARPIGRGGCAGGAMAAVKNFILAHHLAAFLGGYDLDPVAMPIDDVASAVLRLTNLAFVAFGVYLTTGLKLLGDDARKLACLAAWIKAFDLP